MATPQEYPNGSINHITTIMGDTISVCRFQEGTSTTNNNSNSSSISSSVIEISRHTSVTISLQEMEDAITSHFYDDEKPTSSSSTTQLQDGGTNNINNNNNNTRESPLLIMTRYDSHWLDSRRPYRMLSTVFGIEEELEIPNCNNKSFPNPDLQVEVFHSNVVPTTDNVYYHHQHHHHQNGSNYSGGGYCSCRAPHRDWILQERSLPPTTAALTTTTELSSSSPTATTSATNIRWIDLRLWQREHANEPFLTSPGAVTHFLRSILGSSQNESIWLSNQPPISSPTTTAVPPPSVVALVLTHAPSQLINFRVGDASPLFFLHSVAHLQQIPWDDVTWWWSQQQSGRNHQQDLATDQDATLLVYRQLAPRDRLSVFHPKDPLAFPTPKGCIWETYYFDGDWGDKDDDDVNDEDEEEENVGENDSPTHIKKDKKGKDDNVEEEEEEELYRLLAPPYVSCDECYPGVLDPLLTPKSLAILRQEALSIAHWTAWPEKQHYRSASEDADDYDEDEDDIDANDTEMETNGSTTSNSTYPASWTVFPLCYCFPANDPSAMKWIPKTCSLVPKTVALLQQYLGSTYYLRTALFSRLDPETTLEPHVGWADLANHVYRVHIPLVVPPGGLCGTWVDGCVETHEEGRPICLDDSKLHRAFNYANQPRIVLIVDLARPPSLPLGTATGGHSDELDQFIEQMGGET